MTEPTQSGAASPRPSAAAIPFSAHVRVPEFDSRDGQTEFEFVVEEIHLRHGGVMHGGMVATLLDTAIGHAAYSSAPEGAEVMTMQLNINMTATARLGDRVIASAKTVHGGRRTAVVTGELRLASGKLIASGSATMFILPEGVRS